MTTFFNKTPVIDFTFFTLVFFLLKQHHNLMLNILINRYQGMILLMNIPGENLQALD